MLKRKLFLSSAVAIFLSSGFVYAQENEDLQLCELKFRL